MSVPAKTLLIAKGHTSRVTRISFSPDSNTLITSSDDKRGFVVSLKEKEIKEVLPSRSNVSSWAAACAVDTRAGKFVILGANDNSSDLVGWSLSPPYNELFRLQGHSATLTCLQFNPTNPDELLSSCGDKTCKIWDLSQISRTNTKIKCKWELSRNSQSSYSCAYSSCGRIAFAVDAFKPPLQVYAFDTETGSLICTFSTSHSGSIYSCLGRKDSLFTGGNSDRMVQKWSVSRLLEMKKKEELTGQALDQEKEFPVEAQVSVCSNGQLHHCDVTNDASLLAALSSTQKVHFFQIKAKEFVPLLVLSLKSLEYNSAWTVCFSPDASLLAVGTDKDAVIFQNPLRSRWAAATPVFKLRERGSAKNRICQVLKEEWRAFQCVVLFMPNTFGFALQQKEKQEVVKEVDLAVLFPKTITLQAPT